MLDTIIIGAGPVGLYAAYYLHSKGVSVNILEANHQVGGQLMSMYPEKNIYNLPGIKEIKAQDYINDLVNQLDHNELIHLNQRVIDINKVDNYFEISTHEMTYKAYSVVIATGNGELKPRELGVENECNVKNIIYAVTDLSLLTNKDIVIFGGGDSAIDWALHLCDIAKHVSVVHRRNDFRAHASSVEALKASNADIYTPHSLTNYQMDDNTITSISITNKETKEEITLYPDYVICNFGFVYEKNPLTQWGIELDTNKVIVDRKQQSSIDGIFSIGDACVYENKNYNILTGLGEASVVANNVINYLNEMEGDSDGARRTIKNY